MFDKQQPLGLQVDPTPGLRQDSMPDMQPLIDNQSLIKLPITPLPPSWGEPVAGITTMEKLQYPMISVIIPARNEAENLSHVLPHIPDIVSEVILVDGHSSDNTIEVAQQLLPSIRIVKQMGHGKGDALRAGFAACTGDIIVTLDADGSADPKEIPCFVAALELGRDFAKGSRFVKGGGSHDLTFLRQLGNFGLSTLVNMLFGAKFSDLCYGYNAFWKYCLDYIDVDCDGFEVETLINLRMHKANFKIVEVASFEYARIYGKSNLRAFSDGWRVLKTIIKEWTRRTVSPVRSQEQNLLEYVSSEKRGIR